VLAYKFLTRDGCSVFTGTPWPAPPTGEPGAWVASAAVRPCREGIHGATASHLAYWLHDELWSIELDGDIRPARHKVVGLRGRLIQRYGDWPEVSKRLNEVSAWRARDLAVAALLAEGNAELAEGLRVCTTLDELAALAEEAGPLDGRSTGGDLAALAADAGYFGAHGLPMQAPFVAATAAGRARTGSTGVANEFQAGFAEERTFQSAWIAGELKLV
jgi:hypothetical protein